MAVNVWVTDDPYPAPEPTPEPTPDSAAMHVADLDGASALEKKTWRASVTLLVVDGSGASLPEATVTLSSYADSGDLWDTEPCVTGADGRCSISYSRIGTSIGSLTFVVDGVTHAANAYDAAANADPDGDSDGTTIVVAQP